MQQLIRAYKRGLFGEKLAGWVDEFGDTYRTSWPAGPLKQAAWSVDDQGSIFLEAGEYRAMIGWVEEDGAVYAQNGTASSGFFNYPEATQFIQPRKTFSPALAFHVSPDGTVSRLGRRGARTLGHVEGAPNLRAIAAMALVVLF